MEQTTKQITKDIAEKWQIIEQPKEHFTADEVIDAYFKGKEDGLSQTVKALKTLLATNISKTIIHREDILEFLKANKFIPIISYLKISSWNTFEILIVVSEKDFLTESFLKVYDYVNKLEKNVNEDIYNIFFSFTNSSDHLDEGQLESDGFILKYQTLK